MISNVPAIRAVLLAALVLTACAPAATEAPATVAPSSSTPGLATASPGELPVNVTDSSYGSLAVVTAAGAECTAELRVIAGDDGEAPPAALPAQIASSNGIVRWSYAAPRVPNGGASYRATCRSGGRSGVGAGAFDIALRPITASALSVHVTTTTPPQPAFTPDASLVALRDAAAARMKATLTSEWRTATRGLGTLTVVEDSADITIFVVAAKGTSVHRHSSRDDSSDILIYVSDDRLGPTTAENSVATALHELGHIWCCHGPTADDGGHWKVKERDPGLYGVDKYGLMTDPVLCLEFGSVLSCPNRFSDREMRAIGFSTFPPPILDACVTQAFAIDAQLAALDKVIEPAKGTLAGLDAQIKSLERQYPNGMPPATYASYLALIGQYNDLNTQTNQRIRQYNDLLVQRRGLPCDTS